MNNYTALPEFGCSEFSRKSNSQPDLTRPKDMEWALCIAIRTLGFVGTHQPFTFDLNPAPVCNHGATEFGGGLKRLDPGTVNLPIFVGPCPTCAQWQRNLITVWFPRPKK